MLECGRCWIHRRGWIRDDVIVELSMMQFIYIYIYVCVCVCMDGTGVRYFMVVSPGVVGEDGGVSNVN